MGLCSFKSHISSKTQKVSQGAFFSSTLLKCFAAPLSVCELLPVQLLGHPVCVDPVQEHAGVQPDQREAHPVLSQGPAGQTHDRLLPHGAEEGQLVSVCAIVHPRLEILLL